MTTGPGDQKAAGGSDRGYFRASHADREQVVAIALAPDGQTAYVVRAADKTTTLTPVATATGTPGHPVNIGRIPQAIAITG